MAGFDPVGATPVGGLGGTTIEGTYFYPTPAIATFSGDTPSLVGLISPERVSQLTAEVLLSSPSDAYVTQITAEILVPLKYGANVSLTGVNAVASLSSVTIFVPNPISFSVTGVFADGAIGTTAYTAAANVTLTGLSADVSLGNVIASIRKNVFVSGVDATCDTTSVTVLTGCGVRVIGVQALGYIGRPLIWSKINDSQTPDWTIPNTANSVTWAQVTE